MRHRAVFVLVLMAFAGTAPSGATSGQSFLYIASPQLVCARSSQPCPASELLVYDSQTLGLVTRIPLPQDSAEHTLAFAPDGRKLYAVGDKGTTVVDTTTHTATVLPVVGSFDGTRQRGSAMRRDGARLYVQTRNLFDYLRQVNLATGEITRFGTLDALGLDGMAANPVTDRLYVVAAVAVPHSPVVLIEFDTTTEQEVRRIATATGPVAVSPDGARLYTLTTVPGGNRVVALSTSTLTQIGSFEEGVAFRLAAGGRGTRLFSLAAPANATDPARLRVFDAENLQSAPISEVDVNGATNLVPSEDELRVFVGTTVATSSTFDGQSFLITYANRVAVVDALTGQVIRELPLPDSSLRIVGGRPTPQPDPIAALATTPNGAPRCSYRVGPTQNAWTVAGGTASITLTTRCAWVAWSDAPWVRVSQTGGTTGTTLTITVDPAVSAAARAATVTIAGQIVTISQAGYGSTPPFGTIDTPLEGAAGISGALGVTGWALDEAGVIGIRIFRDPVAGEAPGRPVFIGSATMVEGARPDVAAAFSTTPLNTRAGWGLNVLTNMLPNQGHGTFRLYAYIDDVDGHTTVIGPRTFTSSNLNVAVPFGAIDTPGQGETVSGTIVNFGWALTPQPNIMPPDGSTIDVLIDGVIVGHPTYGQPRQDIAALFPGYQNSNGAVGYFVIDTTQYDNGLHTIAWVVRDSAGNAAGIGSRYFWIQN